MDKKPDARPLNDRPSPGRGMRTLTAGEAAAVLGVSVATVRGWADSGRLPSHRTVGGHRRFQLEQLRAWMEQRGAELPAPAVPAEPAQAMPPAPALARILNERVEAIVARALAGYDPAVPSSMPPPGEEAFRRLVTRFVRMVAAAVESGRADALAGRLELAGVRGAGGSGWGPPVLLEHVRAAIATVQEAERALSGAAAEEEHALACLHAAIDHAVAAVARGLDVRRSDQAREG